VLQGISIGLDFRLVLEGMIEVHEGAVPAPDGTEPGQYDSDILFGTDPRADRLCRELLLDFSQDALHEAGEDRGAIIEEEVQRSDLQSRLGGDVGGTDVFEMPCLQ